MTEPQKSVISTTENLDITFPSGENLSITTTKHCVTLNLHLDENNKNTYSGKPIDLLINFGTNYILNQLMKHPRQQDL